MTLLATLILPLLVAPVQDSRHRWKVVVIIPETHISRPRIPDPAVETEINRQIIDAGYKVIDPERARQLLSNEMQDRAMRNDPAARNEILRIARKVGADIVVTGSAFTTVASRVRTDAGALGQVDNIACQARVELKAYRAESGQLAFADAITKVGPPEFSEEISSKSALQAAAEEIGPRVLAGLDKVGDSNKVTISVEVRNVTFSQGTEIREVLRKSSGALEISEGEYDASTWLFDVTVSRTQLPRVSASFEDSPRLKQMHLKIQEANKTRIILNSKLFAKKKS